MNDPYRILREITSYINNLDPNIVGAESKEIVANKAREAYNILTKIEELSNTPLQCNIPSINIGFETVSIGEIYDYLIRLTGELNKCLRQTLVSIHIVKRLSYSGTLLVLSSIILLLANVSIDADILFLASLTLSFSLAGSALYNYMSGPISLLFSAVMVAGIYFYAKPENYSLLYIGIGIAIAAILVSIYLIKVKVHGLG